MEENRQTEIIEEIEENQIEDIESTEENEEKVSRVSIRDNFFEQIKNELLNQERLLKKFFAHSDDHCEFDFEVMGLSFEEEEELVRRIHILKNKILDNLETELTIKCTDRKVDTLHNMIICDSEFEENKFRIVIEVFEDSFDLEVV